MCDLKVDFLEGWDTGPWVVFGEPKPKATVE
jgi:hypothetical protein